MAASTEEKITPTQSAGLRRISEGLNIRQVVKDYPYLNMLIYGESGVGKTTLAGSADEVPELRKVIVIDCEGGTFSLANRDYNVDVVRVKTWEEIQEVYDWLHDGDHDYQTVILDSLTEMQKFNMYAIMKAVVEKDPDRDPDIPSLREWGKTQEQVRRMVRAFRDLDMNVIFTALMKVDKDDRTGVRWTLPDLPGKLASQVAAFLDIVGYYYTKMENIDGEQVNSRLLLTQKTENVIAKDRSDRLDQIVEEPTMRGIFDMMWPNKK